MRKRTIAAVAFLSALTLLCTIAAADPVRTADDDAAIVMRGLVDEFQSLREEIVQLRARVRELEAQLAAAKASQPIPRSPAVSQQRVMRLEGMDTEQIESDISGEVARLLDEADGLDERARAAEEQAIDLRDDPWEGHIPPFWWVDDTDRRERWEDAVRRQRSELRRQAVQYRVQARAKRGEAKRLQHEATQVRQIFWGWDGRRTVILETPRDLAGALRDLDRAGFITWRGHLVGLDGESEVWEVTSVSPAARPRDFLERPPDMPPPSDVLLRDREGRPAEDGSSGTAEQ